MVNNVDKLTYLGNTLYLQANIYEEVKCRITKANSAFGRLGTNVWERRGTSLTTKFKVYQVVVITTFFYACEFWTIPDR